MQPSNNLTQQPKNRNTHPSLESRQFTVAFIQPAPQTNLTQLWSLKASEAIRTLIDFRSSIHRWQATGQVDHAEFVREVQRLEDAGLIDWLDTLIAGAMLEVTR